MGDGRHRGHPPFGYRNGRDTTNRRILLVDATEADIIRTIFAELAEHSFADVAAHLAARAAPAPTAQGWTRYVVREIYLRAKVYLGMVVLAGGLDERPGRHEPIITPDLHRAAVAERRARERGGRKAGPGRTYLLSGRLVCGCGRRMTGQVASRIPKRFYLCRYCRRPMVRAEPLEREVLDAIRAYRVPRATVEAAREELRRRLAGPRDDATARQRKRLEGRLANLRKQHGWGDVDDATYRREKAETEAMLNGLPDEDKLVAFDRQRAAVLDLSEAIEAMTDEERKRTIALFCDEIRPDGWIEWAAPFRPFFAAVVGTVSPEGSEPAVATDPLEWFAEASS